MAQDEKLYRYTVPPFSQAQPNGAPAIPAGSDPCAICNRPVSRATAKYHAVVIDGGSNWGDENSEQDSGYMGYWPVGSDCHRKFVER